MFGNLAEMAKLMQKAKDIQKNMGAMKEELANAEYLGSAANGQVTVLIAGDFSVKRVTIAPAVMTDADCLADLVQIAANSAVSAARAAAQQKMKELTGGMDIPGLF